MHLVYTPKFGINIVYSWDDYTTLKKLKTIVIQNFFGGMGGAGGGGGGVNKVHYDLCENGELRKT